jgi:predicted nucleotidyltransferase component of viral defense system
MRPYEATEHFHLLFLVQLSKRIAPDLFALKGGCNLRFYFKSIRYSEDIDFDVRKISVATLRSNVRTIFKSKTFIDSLSAVGIEIAQTSEPKQTETTQRWKILLRVTGFDREIPTKIEFSRRDGIEGAIMEPVDRDILINYKLYPIACCHYPRIWAVRQKIGALIGRTQTQARDIFDLSLLIHDKLDLKGFILSASDMNEACEHALSLSFDDYQGQVVAYLMPEYQSLYGTELEWNNMVSKVLDFVRYACNESA